MAENDTLLTTNVTDNGVHISKLVPSKILDELQINEIGQQIIALIDKGARKLVLDFSNVDHLSSSALGMLITTKKRLDSVNGSLKLCSIQPQIFQVFQITKLNKLFTIYDTTAEALAE